MNEFQVTGIFEKIIPCVHRHPNTATNKIKEIFLVNFSQPKFMENLIPVSM